MASNVVEDSVPACTVDESAEVRCSNVTCVSATTHQAADCVKKEPTLGMQCRHLPDNREPLLANVCRTAQNWRSCQLSERSQALGTVDDREDSQAGALAITRKIACIDSWRMQG